MVVLLKAAGSSPGWIKKDIKSKTNLFMSFLNVVTPEEGNSQKNNILNY